MKLIIVTAEYPPSPIANATRPYILAREMHARGHVVEVITRDQPAQIHADSIRNAERSAVIVHSIPDPVPAWREKYGKARWVTILSARLWPDPQILWVLRLGRYLRKMKGNATVIALINPASMLLLRWLVPSRRFFFVFDYLESVTPFRKQVPHDFILHRHLTGMMARIERATLRRTDRVIFTCLENQKTYIKNGLCEAAKSFYMPQYCDPNPHASKDLRCDGKMVISYIGYFNRDRSPETFLMGLREFLDKEPTAAEHIAVNCYGNGLGLHPHLATDLNLEGIVNDCGVLDYEKTLGASASSHVLLLVTSPKHHLFFPSKISEYVAARRPILALVPLGSEVSEALTKCGRAEWVCAYDNAHAVAGCLLEAWRRFQSGKLGEILPICESVVTTYYTPVWENILKNRS